MKKLIVFTLCLLMLYSIIFNITVVYEYSHASPKKTRLTIYFNLKDDKENKGISEQEARKYLGENVCIIRDDFTTLYTVYGMVVDVFKYKEEWYLLLKMTYTDQKEMIIKLKDIVCIRERLPNE